MKTCICRTCGKGGRRETEENDMEQKNRNESPRWWPIMWCWELKWEQRISSQPEKWNALQRGTVNFSVQFATTLLSHKRVQGSGIIGNSLKGLSDNTKSVMFEHSNMRGHERCIARKSWSGWEPLVQPQEPGGFFCLFFFLFSKSWSVVVAVDQTSLCCSHCFCCQVTSWPETWRE